MTNEEFEIIDEGEGPAVLCLHGFPENMSAFDAVAKRLVEAGFRVVRYNQRGYSAGTGGLPRWRYTSKSLAGDALRIMDESGVSKFSVIGHDLGGLVAWRLAYIAPERVSRLLIANLSHPAAFLVSLVGIRQLKNSLYIALAQSSTLATWLFSPNHARSCGRFKRRLVAAGMPPERATEYLQFLVEDGRFLGAVKWYQALPFDTPGMLFHRCMHSTHLVVSAKDTLIGKLSIRLSRLWVGPGLLQTIVINSSSHWLPDTNPNDLADVFLRMPNVP